MGHAPNAHLWWGFEIQDLPEDSPLYEDLPYPDWEEKWMEITGIDLKWKSDLTWEENQARARQIGGGAMLDLSCMNESGPGIVAATESYVNTDWNSTHRVNLQEPRPEWKEAIVKLCELFKIPVPDDSAFYWHLGASQTI